MGKDRIDCGPLFWKRDTILFFKMMNGKATQKHFSKFLTTEELGNI